MDPGKVARARERLTLLGAPLLQVDAAVWHAPGTSDPELLVVNVSEPIEQDLGEEPETEGEQSEGESEESSEDSE